MIIRAATIELATKYSGYVDEKFHQDSKTEIVSCHNYKWLVSDVDGADWIKIYKVSTAEMNDYNRSGANNGNWSRYGKIQDLDAETEEFRIDNDRSFTFALDYLDVRETAGALLAAQALNRQIEEVVIPEIDKWTFEVLKINAGHKPDPVTLTKTNIYSEIVKATEALDEACVPDTERILVVTPKTYRLMKECKDITLNTEVGADMLRRGVIGNLDGMTVQRVASSTLPKDFGFCVVQKKCVFSFSKLKKYKVHDNPPGIDGYLVEGRIVYDAFVPQHKKCGIYYQALPES